MTDDAAEVAASGADDSERPAAPPAPPPDPFALPLVSVDDPCGPDLDLAGDADFLIFAAIEGALPGREAKFFYEFKRDSIDFPGSFRDGERLLSRSLDIRVLVLLAKLAILNRDLPGFAAGSAVSPGRCVSGGTARILAPRATIIPPASPS